MGAPSLPGLADMLVQKRQQRRVVDVFVGGIAQAVPLIFKSQPRDLLARRLQR